MSHLRNSAVRPKLVCRRGFWQSDSWDVPVDKPMAFPAYQINEYSVMVVINPNKHFFIKHDFELINSNEAHEIARKLEIFWI